MRILLVDDQAHVLRVIKLSLDRSGFEVDTALNGDTAVAMLKENSIGEGPLRYSGYDVVITDIDMPGMKGTELCDAILRDFPENPPLMFVLGDTVDAGLLSWIEHRPRVELLEKPMSLRFLVARINEHFGHFDKIAAAR